MANEHGARGDGGAPPVDEVARVLRLTIEVAVSGGIEVLAATGSAERLRHFAVALELATFIAELRARGLERGGAEAGLCETRARKFMGGVREALAAALGQLEPAELVRGAAALDPEYAGAELLPPELRSLIRDYDRSH